MGPQEEVRSDEIRSEEVRSDFNPLKRGSPLPWLLLGITLLVGITMAFVARNRLREIEDVLPTGRVDSQDGVFDLRTFPEVDEDRLQLTARFIVDDVSVIDDRSERFRKGNW